MRNQTLLVAIAALLLGGAGRAQEIPFEQQVFNEQVLRPSGQPVVPIFDGWFENPDGTRAICFGYFNLNTEEVVEIALGPDNFIEPVELDGLQPSHFDPVPAAGYRRHFCVFSVTVPKDFGNGRVVWTLRRGGETISTPGKLTPSYVLDEPDAGARGVTAPALELDSRGPAFRGRKGHTAKPRTVSVGEPLSLTVRVDHPAPESWIGWSKHQGPGDVELSQAELLVDREKGAATTTARFSKPGSYLLRVQAIHSTTSFEYHCCWTNGYVPVIVTPSRPK